MRLPTDDMPEDAVLPDNVSMKRFMQCRGAERDLILIGSSIEEAKEILTRIAAGEDCSTAREIAIGNILKKAFLVGEEPLDDIPIPNNT